MGQGYFSFTSVEVVGIGSPNGCTIRPGTFAGSSACRLCSLIAWEDITEGSIEEEFMIQYHLFGESGRGPREKGVSRHFST